MTFKALKIGDKFTFAKVLPGDVGRVFVKFGKISAKVVSADGLDNAQFRVYAATEVVAA